MTTTKNVRTCSIKTPKTLKFFFPFQTRTNKNPKAVLKMFAYLLIGLISIKRTESGLSYMDESDKDFVVSKHNEYRKSIADNSVPGLPAGKFNNIQWDEQMAQSAADFARNCTLGHDMESLMYCGRYPRGCSENHGSCAVYSRNCTARESLAKSMEAWFYESGWYRYGDGFYPGECKQTSQDGQVYDRQCTELVSLVSISDFFINYKKW